MENSTTKTKTKKINGQQDVDKELSKFIMQAIEMDSTFKLYSFRIIDAQQFKARCKELNQLVAK